MTRINITNNTMLLYQKNIQKLVVKLSREQHSKNPQKNLQSRRDVGSWTGENAGGGDHQTKLCSVTGLGMRSIGGKREMLEASHTLWEEIAQNDLVGGGVEWRVKHSVFHLEG